jgi:hypothetical protein
VAGRREAVQLEPPVAEALVGDEPAEALVVGVGERGGVDAHAPMVARCCPAVAVVLDGGPRLAREREFPDSCRQARK